MKPVEGSKEKEDEFVTVTIPINPHVSKMGNEIENKGIELGLFCEIQKDKVMVLGNQEKIEVFKTYLVALENKAAENTNKKDRNLTNKSSIKEENKEDKEIGNNDFIQEEFTLSDNIIEDKPAMEVKLARLGLEYEFKDNKLYTLGSRKQTEEFSSFLSEFESNLLKADFSNKSKGKKSKSTTKTKEESKKATSSSKKRQSVNSDEPISPDPISLEGKKALYPKYWDFEETKRYFKIPVKKRSKEYNEVTKLIFSSMDQEVKIIKIERIQNKDIMDKYIAFIQGKMKNKGTIKRRWLFHGTNKLDPEVICKSDVGFDVHFTGRGLFFAVDAMYSGDMFGYRTDNGNIKLLLADVFVGKAQRKMEDGDLDDERYDSLHLLGESEFFVIYKNYQSYPLYLIEYNNDHDEDNYVP